MRDSHGGCSSRLGFLEQGELESATAGFQQMNNILRAEEDEFFYQCYHCKKIFPNAEQAQLHRTQA